jgi:hypothetical protein
VTTDQCNEGKNVIEISLIRIFGPRSEKAMHLWRTLPNEESYNVFPSAMYGVFNSRNIRWVEHVAKMPEIKNP